MLLLNWFHIRPMEPSTEEYSSSSNIVVCRNATNASMDTSWNAFNSVTSLYPESLGCSRRHKKRTKPGCNLFMNPLFFLWTPYSTLKALSVLETNRKTWNWSKWPLSLSCHVVFTFLFNILVKIYLILKKGLYELDYYPLTELLSSAILLGWIVLWLP